VTERIPSGEVAPLSAKTGNAVGGGIMRSAAVMGVATFFSRIAGLVREQSFAYFFGAGAWTDAFNVAFRIPNLLRDLFAEGAMSAAFVPTFNAVLEKEGRERAFRLTSITLTMLVLVVGAITALGIAVSPMLVKIMAPEFASDSAKFAVTVNMTRIMFPFLLVISLAALVMGVLNSLGEFFVPAVAPVFLNLAMIVAGFTLCPFFETLGRRPIEGMAVGAMIGGFLQLAAQWPALRRTGFRFEWVYQPGDTGMKRIVALMLPGTIGLAATQVNVAISTILATSQGDGAVSWLNYAFRLMQLPLGIFGVAIAQATLPIISRQAAANDREAMAGTLAGSIKLTSFINIVAAMGLAALSVPVIRLLFEHGRFTCADTAATATALQAYAAGLVFFSLIKVLGPAFYALGDTSVPVKASFASVAACIGANLALIGPCGYWGLALGTSVGSGVNALILYTVLSGRMGGFGRYGVAGSLARTLLAGAAMAGAMWWVETPVFEALRAGVGGLPRIPAVPAGLLSLAAAGFAGGIVLVATAKLLRHHEADEGFAMILRRLRRRQSMS